MKGKTRIVDVLPLVALGVFLLSMTAGATLTEDYLSVNGATGVYKYLTGFGDDQGQVSSFDFSGAVTPNFDKYLTDAYSLGTWKRGGTELGAYSTDPTNAVIYKVSMPDEGAAGYLIVGGGIYARPKIYQHDGQVAMFLSTDGSSWSAPLVSDVNTVDGWRWLPHDLIIPQAYTGGDTIWVKFTGSCPDGNDWAALEDWGIRLELQAVPEPGSALALASGLSAFAALSLRRRRS